MPSERLPPEDEIVSKARQKPYHRLCFGLNETSSKCEEVEDPHQHGD